jgi:hypothetical protein
MARAVGPGLQISIGEICNPKRWSALYVGMCRVIRDGGRTARDGIALLFCSRTQGQKQPLNFAALTSTRGREVRCRRLSPFLSYLHPKSDLRGGPRRRSCIRQRQMARPGNCCRQIALPGGQTHRSKFDHRASRHRDLACGSRGPLARSNATYRGGRQSSPGARPAPRRTQSRADRRPLHRVAADDHGLEASLPERWLEAGP